MGYRSDVVYGILCNTPERKKEFVAMCKLNSQFKMALEELEDVYTDTPYIWGQFNFVKWYSDYDDVACHEALLKHIEDDEVPGVSARLVRVGEEEDDVDDIYYEGGDDAPDRVQIDIYPQKHTEIVNHLARD